VSLKEEKEKNGTAFFAVVIIDSHPLCSSTR